jgi:hypothetical protein
MFAIIGACLFSVVIILSLLIICGLPLASAVCFWITALQ